MKPFRFGASVAYAPTGEAWRETARRIEGWGYTTLLLPDHLVVPFAPIPALVAAADAAPSLRVGTMVIANDFRNPALLAKEVATADVMTDGRFELGIGAGWLAAEYDAAGIVFEDAAVRVDRLEEALAILRALWADGPVAHDGPHYRVAGLEGTPKPVQRPIPMMIGGGGKRVLRLAAREADIVSLAPSMRGAGRSGRPDLRSLTAEGVAERIGWIREAAAGRDVEISTYYAGGRSGIVHDREAAAHAGVEALAQRFGAPVTLDPTEALVSPQFLYGSVDEVVDRLQEYRERYGISYVVLTEEDVEAFAPVVARLAGR